MMIYFPFLLVLFSFVFSEVSIECQEMFMKYKHPYVCCKYPMRKIFERDQDNCKSKCKNIIGEKDCCYLNCIYRETGIIFDEVFHEHALLKLYENYLETEGAGKYDKWTSVVEKNIRTCAETIPNTGKFFTCQIPEYVVEVTDCVNLMNYLNCPTFERTEQCESAREMIKSLKICGNERNGTFLINYEYWDFELMDMRQQSRLDHKKEL